MDSIIGIVVVVLLLVIAYWMGHSHGYDDRQLDKWIREKLK